jgi:hypothetical protein
VDAGEGWLIFALPASELGVHPTEGASRQQLHGGRHLVGAVLYLMCSDLPAYMQVLQAQKVCCSAVEKEPWGIKPPSGYPAVASSGYIGPHIRRL